MKRLWITMLGVLALASLSMASSAMVSSASAAECKAGGTEFTVCYTVGSILELAPAAEFLATQESTVAHVFKANVGGVSVTIECTAGTSVAKAASPGKTLTGALITFTGCTVTKPEHCAVNGGTIETEPILGTLSLVGGLLDILFEPESGTKFATLTLTSSGGTCSAAISGGAVTGTQLCTFLEPIETDEELHLFECAEAGSELKFAKNEATLQDEWEVLMLKPVEDALWSIQQDVE